MNIAAGGARVRSRLRRVRGRHRGSNHAGRRAPDPLGDQQMSLTPRRRFFPMPPWAIVAASTRVVVAIEELALPG
jgi:hypothetical protein